MTQETFVYLWEEGIVKAAQAVLEDIRSKFGEKLCQVDIDVSDEKQSKVYQAYDEIKNQVRTDFFDTGEKNEKKIDGHKIAACITGALLNVRLVTFDLNAKNVPKEIVYANYSIAFMASIYILYLFLLSDLQKEGKIDVYNKLLDKATFDFPETNKGHDSYVIGRIKTLALNDLNGIDFDVLTYADMLFWIEKYNKDLLNKIV